MIVPHHDARCGVDERQPATLVLAERRREVVRDGAGIDSGDGKQRAAHRQRPRNGRDAPVATQRVARRAPIPSRRRASGEQRAASSPAAAPSAQRFPVHLHAVRVDDQRDRGSAGDLAAPRRSSAPIDNGPQQEHHVHRQHAVVVRLEPKVGDADRRPPDPAVLAQSVSADTRPRTSSSRGPRRSGTGRRARRAGSRPDEAPVRACPVSAALDDVPVHQPGDQTLTGRRTRTHRRTSERCAASSRSRFLLVVGHRGARTPSRRARRRAARSIVGYRRRAERTPRSVRGIGSESPDVAGRQPASGAVASRRARKLTATSRHGPPTS